MSKCAIALTVLVLLAGAVFLVADEPRVLRQPRSEAVVMVESNYLLFSPGGPGEVLLTDIKRDVQFRIELPETKDVVTEVRACRWLSQGFAAVVETIPEKPDGPSQRSYFWVTGPNPLKPLALDKNTPKQQKQRPLLASTGARFLTSDVDFDLTAIANPSGDSIYALLTRYRRDRGDGELTGYIFTHHCPIVPSGGMLQRIANDPKSTQWIGLDPDEIPPE